ncbi:MAG: hypothetical protein INF02_10920, partial [Phenylobacterium sp.]|uniref:condensation domain-containing protein n=1 Tax=Phenylobacterium sp. TaxID=1871053 RepID=UPI0025E6E421
TTFHEEADGVLGVRVAEGGGRDPFVFDMSGMPSQAAVDAAVAHGLEACAKPFELSVAPPFVVHLYKTGDRSFVLMLLVDHIIFDGWSFGVLLNELSQLYSARTEPADAVLPRTRSDYMTVTSRARTRAIAAAGREESFTFWSRFLAELGPPPLLPSQRPRAPVQAVDRTSLDFALDDRVARDAEEISRRHGVTLFAVLLAAVAVVLGRRAEVSDLLFKTAVAGRDDGDSLDLIGLFRKVIMLRLDLGENPDVAELLARARAASMGVLTHLDVAGGPILVNELMKRGVLKERPRLPVSVILQNYPMPRPTMAGLDVEPLLVSYGGDSEDLGLVFTTEGGGLSVKANFNRALFDPDYIGAIATAVGEAVRAMAARPEARAWDLDAG